LPTTEKFVPSQVHLDLRLFSFRNEEANRSIKVVGPDDRTITTRETLLPHRELHGLCESLIYDDHLPSRLIRFISRMVSITAVPYLNPHLVNFNRLILLHGPSGTGKSTLCRAIAYKLSIILCPPFRRCILLEMNTSCMFSSWFGESASLVEQSFKAAFDRAAADPEMLVCVLIDEIESIAGSRERALESQEVADSARATNQLLIALDKMRSMPNMLMLCTTNLVSAVVR
jgi:hypothetical protein